MSQPYVGEIRMFGGNFAPEGWAFCDGSLITISQNSALFQLIGTTFGGDGQNTFALPDLRSRVPMHAGAGFVIGQSGGEEGVTLTTNQIPAHTHAVAASSNNAMGSIPNGAFLAAGPNIYTNTAPAQTMAPAISSTGGNQPHNNIQPYLCINFILSLFGVFPSQS